MILGKMVPSNRWSEITNERVRFRAYAFACRVRAYETLAANAPPDYQLLWGLLAEACDALASEHLN